jgi:hypothetical protein
MTRPSTGFFQIAVNTVLPCHSTSRGRPTFTEMTELTVNLHHTESYNDSVLTVAMYFYEHYNPYLVAAG